MNVWQWLHALSSDLRESGQERLADILETSPVLVSENRVDEACSLIEEGLALAREARLPWAIVYLRHWRLQGTVFGRLRVREYLAEAVDLIEYASRDEARGCPQSVCSTQDLVIAYGALDGQGYAEERRAAAAETLSRIDATWPCFECLSSEYADALTDVGDAEAAIAFLDRQRGAIAAAGGEVTAKTLALARLDALCALGRFAEAAELAPRARQAPHGGGELLNQKFQLIEARALAELGRGEEASALVSDEAALAAESCYTRWAHAVLALCRSGDRQNSWQLHATLNRLTRKLADQKAMSAALSVTWVQAMAAALRGRPLSLRRTLERIDAMSRELRRPELLTHRLSSLRDTLARLEATPPSTSAVELGEDPEDDLTWWAALPPNERYAPESAGRAAAAWTVLEEIDAALEVVRLGRDMTPADEGLASRWLDLVSRAADDTAFAQASAELLQTGDAPLVRIARVARAERLRQQGSVRESIGELETLLDEQPEELDARYLLATVLRESGDFPAALAHLDALVGKGAAPGNVDWDRMTVAASLERWDVVRASAARLEIDLPGESGPIEYHGPLCRLRLAEDDGEHVDLYARRTSPVTARVIEVRAPSRRSYYADVWTFDAGPLNDPPAEGEAEEHTWLYPAVHRLQAGEHVSYDIDGLHPGDDVIETLNEDAAAHAVRLHIAANENYCVKDRDGQSVRGLYAWLIAPRSIPEADLHRWLVETASRVHTPLFWPKLAEAAGDKPLATRFRNDMARHGIEES